MEEEKDTIKDKVNKFNTDRTMFYFKKDNIVFPDYKHINCSHETWFDSENINVDKVIRGYRLNRDVYLYIGRNFEIPNITYNMIEQIKNIFPDIWNIYLGCKQDILGKQWKGIKEIKIYNVD